MEPLSEDMKTIVPIGMLVCSSFWAVMTGPIVLVCRWKANSSNELHSLSAVEHSFWSLDQYRSHVIEVGAFANVLGLALN